MGVHSRLLNAMSLSHIHFLALCMIPSFAMKRGRRGETRVHSRQSNTIIGSSAPSCSALLRDPWTVSLYQQSHVTWSINHSLSVLHIATTIQLATSVKLILP